MAAELLQNGPAEQSPDKAKKEKEVNDLLQQVGTRECLQIDRRSAIHGPSVPTADALLKRR